MSDEQLRSLYAWIDAIPLSRPKRNITRDFSDGVLIAEVIAAYFPQLVDLHNYSPASAIQQKTYNFETLNQKVLKRLGYQLTRTTIDNVVNGRPGAVEEVLNTLQFKMAKYKEKMGNDEKQQSPRQSPRAADMKISPVRNNGEQAPQSTSNQSPSRKVGKAAPVQEKSHLSARQAKVMASVDEELILEKEQKIRELQETVEILELKVSKLEQLVRLKDNKIQKLLQNQK